MTILALDPSTKSSGYAIYKNQDLIAYGCITAGSANLYHRIDKMVEEIEKLIKEYEVEEAIIEDVFPDDVHNNYTVYKTLVYLQGFILHKLDELKVPSSFLIPGEWRKKCRIHTGRGIKRETLKQQDINFVKNQFGIIVNDDTADAICIGFAKVGGVIKSPQVIKTEEDDFEFA